MNLTGSVTHIRGSKYGLPILTLRVRVKNNLGQAAAVLSTSAEVHAWRGPHAHGLPETACALGPATLQLYSGQLANGAETTWLVGLPISHHLLQQVEQLRRSADLVLILNIRYVAALADQTGLNRFIYGSVNSDPTPQQRTSRIASPGQIGLRP